VDTPDQKDPHQRDGIRLELVLIDQQSASAKRKKAVAGSLCNILALS